MAFKILHHDWLPVKLHKVPSSILHVTLSSEMQYETDAGLIWSLVEQLKPVEELHWDR